MICICIQRTDVSFTIAFRTAGEKAATGASPRDMLDFFQDHAG